MKRLALRLTTLLLLVFLAFNFSDPYFRDKKFFKKTINTLHKNDDINIFILGSSRAHSSYDPRLFEEELGVKTFNLGAPAQKLEATSVAIAYALNVHEPKIAIVYIFVLSIGKYYTEKNKNDQLQTLNQIPFSIYKSKKVFEIFKPEGFVNGISPTIRNHSAWNDVLFEDFSNDYKITNGVDYYNGFRAYNKSIDDVMWKKFLEKQKGQNEYNRNVQLTEEEKKKIDEIASILLDKGCTPIFVNAPTYVMDYNARNRKYSGKIREYLKEKDLIYLNLNDWKDSLGLNKQFFSDPNHLNPQGAKIISESLSNYIKKNINLTSNVLPLEYLQHNRYYHFKNNLQTIKFKKDIEDSVKPALKNLTKIGIYNVASDIVELVIEVKDTTNLKIPVRITYNDVVVWRKLNKANLFTFTGKFYVVFPFTLKKKELDNIDVFVGSEDKYPIMSIKDKTTI